MWCWENKYLVYMYYLYKPSLFILTCFLYSFYIVSLYFPVPATFAHFLYFLPALSLEARRNNRCLVSRASRIFSVRGGKRGGQLIPLLRDTAHRRECMAGRQ